MFMVEDPWEELSCFMLEAVAVFSELARSCNYVASVGRMSYCYNPAT
jgi:hypothetical protein